MIKLTILVVPTLLVMVGCAAHHRAETATRAQNELIGMSKKNLLSCAGVPQRQDRVDDLEFLTFSGGGDGVGGAVVTQTSPSRAVVTGRANRRSCDATFVLKDGVVQKVNYQGRTGGLLTKGEQCAF